MTIDLDKLEALARAATPDGTRGEMALHRAQSEYRQELVRIGGGGSAHVVLALIAELRVARATAEVVARAARARRPVRLSCDRCDWRVMGDPHDSGRPCARCCGGTLWARK